MQVFRIAPANVRTIWLDIEVHEVIADKDAHVPDTSGTGRKRIR